jgi:thioesterase domain-containing protein/acyl carrier protein
MTDAADVRLPRTPQEELLCDLFAEILDVDRVGIEDNFFTLGGTSVAAMRLVGRIKATFGVFVGVEAVFDTPTVGELTSRLLVGGSQDGFDTVLALRSQGGQPPLFCIHPGGGLSWCYSGLLREISPDYPIYGIQARGLRPGDPVAANVAEMVSDYAQAILEIQPNSPYQLLGWSFGGALAHALACQLQADGAEIAMLAVIDADPGQEANAPTPGIRDIFLSLLDDLGYDQQQLADVPLRHDRIVEILRREGSALAQLTKQHVLSIVEIFANNIRILQDYVPARFHGDLLLFSAVDGSGPSTLAEAWSPYIDGTIEDHAIVCEHRNMVRPAVLSHIARIVNQSLPVPAVTAEPRQ